MRKCAAGNPYMTNKLTSSSRSLFLKDTVSQCWSVVTAGLYTVWTLFDVRPLEPNVWTLMWTGILRSTFSRMHCRAEKQPIQQMKGDYKAKLLNFI